MKLISPHIFKRTWNVCKVVGTLCQSIKRIKDPIIVLHILCGNCVRLYIFCITWSVIRAVNGLIPTWHKNVFNHHVDLRRSASILSIYNVPSQCFFLLWCCQMSQQYDRTIVMCICLWHECSYLYSLLNASMMFHVTIILTKYSNLYAHNCGRLCICA